MTGAYGLRFDNMKRPWLVQGSGSVNLLGVKAKPKELTVKGARPCPHQYVPARHDVEIPTDPFLTALLPRMNYEVCVLSSSDITAAETNMILGFTAELPFTGFHPFRIKSDIAATNVAPYVLYGLKRKQMPLIRDVLDGYYQRPLTLVVEDDLPVEKLHRVDTMTRTAEEWEAIRNRIIWNYLTYASDEDPTGLSSERLSVLLEEQEMREPL